MSDTDSTLPEFRWLERGDGEPIVLLHGLMGTMRHWEETLDALAPVGRAIALSLPILERDMPEIRRRLEQAIENVRREFDCEPDTAARPMRK